MYILEYATYSKTKGTIPLLWASLGCTFIGLKTILSLWNCGCYKQDNIGLNIDMQPWIWISCTYSVTCSLVWNASSVNCWCTLAKMNYHLYLLFANKSLYFMLVYFVLRFRNHILPVWKTQDSKNSKLT